MNCSCRTIALRLFVRNLTQLHALHISGSPLAKPPKNEVGRTYSSLGVAWSHSRGLHGTASQYGAPQAAVVTAPDHSDIPIHEPDHQDGSAATQTAEPPEVALPQNLGSDTSPRQPKPRKSPRKPTTRTSDTDPKKRERKPKPTVPPSSTQEVEPTPDEKSADSDGTPPQKENWQIQKAALKEKFPEGWVPKKKLSPDALEGIRALNQQYPDVYTSEVLAKRFEVSPEAVRRILKSKWKPSPEEEEKRQERWFGRGKQIWNRWAVLGKKPPRRWREEGIFRPPTYSDFKRREGIRTGSQGKRNRLLQARKKTAERHM